MCQKSGLLKKKVFFNKFGRKRQRCPEISLWYLRIFLITCNALFTTLLGTILRYFVHWWMIRWTLVNDFRASVKVTHSVTYRYLWRDEVRCGKIKHSIDAIHFKTIFLVMIKFSWCYVIKNNKKIMQHWIYTAIKTLRITFYTDFNEINIYEFWIFQWILYYYYWFYIHICFNI